MYFDFRKSLFLEKRATYGNINKKTNRVWRTVADAEFANDSSALKKYSGETFCRSGKLLQDEEDNIKDNHPEFNQKWPYNSFMDDKVFIKEIESDYIMNFDIPSSSSTTAQFTVGEDVYYKSNETFLKAIVTSLAQFDQSATKRLYNIKVDAESTERQMTEVELYKIVRRYNYSKY